MVAATAAFAANWTQIPGFDGSAYVDMASVRQDTYPKSQFLTPKSYLVAWLATSGQDGKFLARLEVVFDCKGRFGIVQQLIENESKDSEFHSFDAPLYRSHTECRHAPCRLIPSTRGRSQ
jgi:hypothetical protein